MNSPYGMAELSLSVEFGKVVREWRHAKKVSQEEFAYRCGISRTYITQIERGGKMPSIDILARLARAFEVEISAFFIELEKRDVTVMRITDAPTPKWGN